MSYLLRSIFTHTTTRHKKLSEELANGGEDLMKKDGLTFCCKYLGHSLVVDPKGEGGTADAIAHIIARAKQTIHKPAKVMLQVCLRGIEIYYAHDHSLLLSTSIYRISYCSADAHYDHVFAFIATNDKDELECHAFLCAKRKIAQDVAIAIAQCFSLAYECWKENCGDATSKQEEGKREEAPAKVMSKEQLSNCYCESNTSSPRHGQSEYGSSEINSSGYSSSTPTQLIDLDDSIKDKSSSLPPFLDHVKNEWAQFDELTEFEDMFSRCDLDNWKSTSAEIASPVKPRSAASVWSQDQQQCRSNNVNKTTVNNCSINTSTTAPPPHSLLNDPWSCLSTSPNSSFLDLCQSPPFDVQQQPKFNFPALINSNKTDPNVSAASLNSNKTGLNLSSTSFNSDKTGPIVCNASLNSNKTDPNVSTASLNTNKTGVNLFAASFNSDKTGPIMCNASLNSNKTDPNVSTTSLNSNKTGVNVSAASLNSNKTGVNVSTALLNSNNTSGNCTTSSLLNPSSNIHPNSWQSFKEDQSSFGVTQSNKTSLTTNAGCGNSICWSEILDNKMIC